MSDPLTILHVLAPAQFGGLESVVRLLAIGQHERGHRVLVAANAEPGAHPLLDALTAAGVRVERFFASARQIGMERAHVRRLIDANDVRVMHSHGYRPDVVDLPVARKRGVATVTTLHGFTGGDWKVRLYERLQVRAARHADAVIAVSTGVVDRCVRHGVRRDRIHVFRNAYAPAGAPLSREAARRALGLDPTAPYVVWIGRLSEEKAPDRMIDALGALADHRVRLAIVGDGPMRDLLRERATQFGVTDRLTFLGAVPDASRYLRGFDAFALSSRTEGTPMVLLEAMAAGIPIVVTAVGGVPDVVSPSEAALIRTDGADERAIATHLAQEIRLAVERGPEVTQRVRAAETRLESVFGLAAWLDRHDALYRTILHSSPSRS